MNISKRLNTLSRHIHAFFLSIKKYLPRQHCQTFGDGANGTKAQIQSIYVINLDRQPLRWRDMVRELDNVVDSTRTPLSQRVIRHSACDGLGLTSDSVQTNDVDAKYTLADQLFVEPQPHALPDAFDLERPIRMSNAEIAVARSHIDVWRRFVQSGASFALILEDDVLFQRGFGKLVDKAWREMMAKDGDTPTFDVLYLSYKEVRFGAPKELISETLFRPERGLWYMSGYVLSKKGAARLLQLLPCRGPIDLWINHKFQQLEVRAVRRSVINQRLDLGSTNSYSILPILNRIGVISDGAALFHHRPKSTPVFAFGSPGSGLSSLAMALSMLGYRCCSDLDRIPEAEMGRLLYGQPNRLFDAYVNIGALTECLPVIKRLYPHAKFLITTKTSAQSAFFLDELHETDLAVLNEDDDNPWRRLCEHLRLAPPQAPYPFLREHGQRTLRQSVASLPNVPNATQMRHDPSPWVVPSKFDWCGIAVDNNNGSMPANDTRERYTDSFTVIQPDRWSARTDTFPGNLALFRPSNVLVLPGGGVSLIVREEQLGVRDLSAAALSSIYMYRFGRFEVTLKPSNVTGVVTGFFLHRDSPRQEIDIEIAGNRPDQLIVNVFYNPGSEGARFDYGYRGTPTTIPLGFDASQAPHRYAVEWDANEIRWYVDGELVHRRVLWNPTPIPDLPMTLHVNTWATQSHELAGQLKTGSLPASSFVSQICVDATEIRRATVSATPARKTVEVC
jgi:GR25 family glycosyltransferase involved in LPS biosynthesis